MPKTSADILAELEIEGQLEASLRELLRGSLSLENAQTKLKVLDNYTKEKTLRELKSEVEKARAAYAGQERAWQLEKRREDWLEQANPQLQARLPVGWPDRP